MTYQERIEELSSALGEALQLCTAGFSRHRYDALKAILEKRPLAVQNPIQEEADTREIEGTNSKAGPDPDRAKP